MRVKHPAILESVCLRPFGQFNDMSRGHIRLQRECKFHALLLYQIAVGFGTAVTEKLPDISHFLDLVQIEIGQDQFLFVPRTLGEKFPTWRTEVTLTIKLTDIPRLLTSNAIDGTDKVPVRHRVRGLFQLPQIFAQR